MARQSRPSPSELHGIELQVQSEIEKIAKVYRRLRRGVPPFLCATSLARASGASVRRGGCRDRNAAPPLRSRCSANSAMIVSHIIFVASSASFMICGGSLLAIFCSVFQARTISTRSRLDPARTPTSIKRARIAAIVVPASPRSRITWKAAILTCRTSGIDLPFLLMAVSAEKTIAA